MQDLINDSLVCEWSKPFLLIFSENVFEPLIYYSHLSSLVLVLFVTTVIFFSSRERIVSKLLLWVGVTFSVWVFSDLVLWATDKPSYTMFFWTLLIIFEPLVYASAYLFSDTLLFDRKKLEFSRVISVFIILLPTIILASTQYGLMSFDYTNCDRAANEGPLAIYGYLVELYFVVMIIYTACKALYKKILSYSEIIFFTVGMIGFLIAFSIGNVVEVFTENWFIGQIGLLGVPFFILILVYLITRFKTINVRTVISEFLIAILFIAILSLLFIEDLSTAKYIVYATLAMVAVLGDILIKSIYKSEKQNSELLRLNLRLTELDKQKSEFVSFATHQLRSPITALKGYASLLLEGEYGKLNEQMTEPIKRIYDSSVTLNAVVDDYLNISRIELGTMKYDFIPLSLKDLVDTTVAELKPNIDRSGVSWSYVTCDSPCMINADKERIKQVISNLIDNGLKYSNKTNVKVTLERDDSTRIVRFTVEDGGIGIAPEVLGKLFEKFVRANSANIANIRGTGLGLFVAREIIRVHKGRIFGESLGENKGSKFTVELPLV